MTEERGVQDAPNLIWLLRLLVLLHAGVALAQAITAGSFMDGQERALNLHQVTGTTVITSVSLLQVVVAAICWRRRQLAMWFPIASLAVFFLEAVQIGLGFTDRMALHVPVGTVIVGATMVLLYASLRHHDPRRPDEQDDSNPKTGLPKTL